ncbi:MAG TPA: hypothetical protein DCY03_20310, partial [Planctomycetaceae bacterium]|nr:hypothetical protein [Planctomycetaceae bacterium]
AAWHLADKMSWQELAAKSIKHLGGAPASPYFNQAELQYASQLVGMAHARARDRNDSTETASTTKARTETARSFEK